MFYSLRLDNIYHSTTIPYSHGLLLLMLLLFKKNKKKFGEWRPPMVGCPYGGGAPACVDEYAPAGSHTQRTPAQHTARRQMYARQHTRRPVPSVCGRNVRLLANAKRAYLRAFRVIYKYIYIVTRKAKKIHKFTTSSANGTLHHKSKKRHERIFIYFAAHAQRLQIVRYKARKDARQYNNARLKR